MGPRGPPGPSGPSVSILLSIARHFENMFGILHHIMSKYPHAVDFSSFLLYVQ